MLLQPFINRNIVQFLLRTEDVLSTSVQELELLLVSGRLFEYLVPFLQLFPLRKVLGVVDSYFGSRLRNGRPASNDSVATQHIATSSLIKWNRLQHAKIGGATDFIALFVSLNLEIILCKEKILERGIRHFFDAGIKPGPPPEEFRTPRFGHYYLMDDLLVPGLYDLPVLCSTHFHATGQGYRALNLEELAASHGFPRSVILPSFPKHMLTYPPFQLLTSSLDSMWPMLPLTFSSALLPPILKIIHESCTWIPALRRYLSHDWIDASLITSTASKADDAELPCRLWDNRLDLLYPGCTPYLGILRQGFLQWMRRRLVREISDYLCETFGYNWVNPLHFQRQSSFKAPFHGEQGGITARNLGTESQFQTMFDYNASKATNIRSQEDKKGSDSNTTPLTNNLTTGKKSCTDLLRQVDKITEVLTKICDGSWWEWDVGSSLFFWRWGESANLALNGMVPFISGTLPQNVKKGRSLAKNENISKITKKLSTIFKRGYIKPGFVKSLIDFFAVPKGDDIRLVYNGTSCGLNEATWAPNFWLPYPRTALRLLDYGYYSVDVDLEEMFLNFPLHDSIKSSSGIYLSEFQETLGIGDGTKKVWYNWTRNWMGARMSPYSSVQFCSLAEEFC